MLYWHDHWPILKKYEYWVLTQTRPPLYRWKQTIIVTLDCPFQIWSLINQTRNQLARDEPCQLNLRKYKIIRSLRKGPLYFYYSVIFCHHAQRDVFWKIGWRDIFKEQIFKNNNNLSTVIKHFELKTIITFKCPDISMTYIWGLTQSVPLSLWIWMPKEW